MIIVCPACATRYVVPDNAVGIEGRTVRCAKCKESWFQEGPDLSQISAPAATPVQTQPEHPAPAAPPPVPVPAAQPHFGEEPPQSVQAPSSPAQSVQSHAVQPQTARPAVVYTDDNYPEPPVTAPPTYADEGAIEEPPPSLAAEAAAPRFRDYEAPDEPAYSQFEHEPPFRPRRNTLKLWTIAAVIAALVCAGTVAAVSYWGLPDWVPISRPEFGLGQPDLVLDFPADQQDRRKLPNGTEYFGASGSVTNVGSQAHNVPPILIKLRDERDRVVYSWEITPSKRRLAPGETLSINEAMADVPPAARVAEIGWKPE